MQKSEQTDGDVKAVADVIRAQRPLPRRRAREPRRRCARLDAGRDARARSAREGRRDVPLGQRSDARRVRLPRPERASRATCLRISTSACSSPWTVPTSDASARSETGVDRAKLVVNVDHHHDNSRFGNVNLIVANASSTSEIVRDILRDLDVALTPGDRGRALRRPRHRHGALPVHEHDAEGAAARGRARRGGR